MVPRSVARRALTERSRRLEVYSEPLPLVVEVWSRSTGDRDRGTKLADYRSRGELEIWLIQPYERTITAWRRQPDGSYQETTFRGGALQPVGLPGATIPLDGLCEPV